jgi:heme/copper-type cytochrome/quinol oxidase subunit 4
MRSPALRIEPFTRPALWALVALTLLALGLRLYRLGGATPWIDEITVMSYAAPPKTPGEIIRAIFDARLRGFTGQHMPMQYVLANLMMPEGGAPPTEIAARVRLPFALFGALTIPLIALATRDLYGARAGVWTGLLAAISFFHVYQSRDATSYGPLLFFQALALWAAVRLGSRSDPASRASLRWAGLLLVGLLGMFFTHLISWFFAATLGLLAFATVAGRVWKKNPDLPVWCGPALVAVVIATAAAPFLRFPLAAAGGAGLVDDVRERLTLDLFAYQLAAFGWGRGDGRLAAFALALGWGCFAAWRRAPRAWFVGHMALIAVPTVIFFVVLMRDFFPRYLAAIFIPFIAIAGVGLAEAQEWLAARRAAAGRLFALAAVVILALWHRAPFETLYAVRDKLMPFSIARDWIVANVPPGGLYMWRNGYFLREVPGALETPGRQAVYADHPNAGIPREVFAQRSELARDVFRRFPETVLITEPPTSDFYPHQELWNWTTQFPHSARFHDPTLARLWRWGFSPHGYRMQDMAAFVARWRTRDEILRERTLAGRPSIWPTGPGWRYAQTREGIVLASPGAEDARLMTVVPASGSYRVLARGTAPASGRLSIWLVRGGQWTRLSEELVGKSDGWQAAWGPWELAPGDQLSLKALGGPPHFLFVYDFELVTP